MLLLWSVLVMPLSKWPLGSNKMFLKWISVLTKDIFKRRFQRWLQSTPISCSQDERMKYQHRPLHPFYPDVAPQKTTPTSKAPAATTHLIFILESHWKSFFGSRILLDFSVNLLQKLLLLWLSVYSNIGWLHNPNVSKSEVEAATEDQTNQSSSLSTAWTSCCRALEFFFPPGRIKALFRGMRSSDNFRALVSTDYNHYRAWVGKKKSNKTRDPGTRPSHFWLPLRTLATATATKCMLPSKNRRCQKPHTVAGQPAALADEFGLDRIKSDLL